MTDDQQKLQVVETIEEPEQEQPEQETPEVPYHTLLEVWSEVLAPVTKESIATEPISPQWATKIVAAYEEVSYADTPRIHVAIFEMAKDLRDIVLEEIKKDPDALKHTTPSDDSVENAEHYRSILFEWQAYLMRKEMEWSPTDSDAPIMLAAMSEVNQMFLGEKGLVGHLEAIRFEFDEEAQEEMGDQLLGIRTELLEKRREEARNG